jgi:hypothetical protein
MKGMIRRISILSLVGLLMASMLSCKAVCIQEELIALDARCIELKDYDRDSG